MPICYIKDKKTFQTKHMAHARYDMTLHSIYDEATTVTLPGGRRHAAEGDFVFVDGFAGLVRECEAEKGTLKLTCGDMQTLLRRDMLTAENTAGGTVEAFLKRVIDAHFVNVADETYRLPWMRVTARTETPGAPPQPEGGVWNLWEYLATVRQAYGVHAEFSAQGDALCVDLLRRQPKTHNIDLSMSDCETLEEVVNVKRIGRITALAEDTGQVTDWYRLEDGSVTKTYTPAGRAQGEWVKRVVGKQEDVEAKVVEEFAKNSYSHLLEFATERELGFMDKVNIRTRQGQTLHSYISAVRKKSGQRRAVYKTGELRVLLSQQLNQRLK